MTAAFADMYAAVRLVATVAHA